MRFAAAVLIGSLCFSSVVPIHAESAAPIDESVGPVPPNPASDACASAAAFLIAPQVFQDGDEKDLPEWIRVCNAHPDASMCRDTIKLISDNHKVVPPELKCGENPERESDF
jgi:hypothetical protein